MKQGISKPLKDALGDNNVCYVVLTCSAPDSNGEMNVEMTYEGEPALAAYLLEGAQAQMGQTMSEECDHVDGEFLKEHQL